MTPKNNLYLHASTLMSFE